MLDNDRKWYYWGFFIMTCLDYWQVIFSGSFRALGKMDIFNKFNFVTYFIIIIPLSCVLSFKVGKYNGYTKHGWFFTENKDKDGLG